MGRGRRVVASLGGLALGVVACVTGFRGVAGFSGAHGLGGIQEVRVRLPDTPIDIIGCTPVQDDPEACPETLRYNGVWDSVGGTAKDAEDHAATPTLHFTREDGFGALSAVVPLSVDGLVDLTMETVTLPADRDLQVLGGLGDVSVDGPNATVTVAIEIGNVSVRGGAGGVGINTGHGSVEIVTSGHADVRTSFGGVTVEQTSGVRDLTVRTGDGDIIVQLNDDTDVELTVDAPGTIRVDTPQITAVADGSFNRRLGTGAVRISLWTARGAVTVTGP